MIHFVIKCELNLHSKQIYKLEIKIKIILHSYVNRHIHQHLQLEQIPNHSSKRVLLSLGHLM